MPMLGEYELQRLLDALIGQESNNDPNAVSPTGVRGLAQVTRDTWRKPGYGATPMLGGTFESFQDPKLQREFAGQYLTGLHKKLGSVEGALAAYNGGENRARAYMAGQPVRPETQNYPSAVLARYKASTPTQTAQPTPARMQWDALLMQKFNPISSAHAADGPPQIDALNHPTLSNEMAGPKDASRLMPEGMPTMGQDGMQPFSPNDPSLLNPPEAPPGPPTSITPTSDNPAVGGGGDASDQYLEQLRTRREPKDDRWGRLADAGMAIGAHLMGMGSGTAGPNVGAVLGAGINRRNSDLEERKLDQEQGLLETTYEALRQQGRDQGLSASDAAKRAFLLVSSPDAAKAAGFGGKTYGVNPKDMVDDAGNEYSVSFSDTGDSKVHSVMGPDGKTPLKPAPSTEKVDAGTHWVIRDKHTGVHLGTIPKNLKEQKIQEQQGGDIATARQNLPRTLDGINQMLGTVDQALEDKENRVAYHGYSGYMPWNTASPAVRDYAAIDKQIVGQNFLAGFQNVKGAGPVSDREGQAATEAQSEFKEAFSAAAKEKALRKMQYLGLRVKVRAYKEAEIPVPSELEARLESYKKHFPEYSRWLDEGETGSSAAPKIEWSVTP